MVQLVLSVFATFVCRCRHYDWSSADSARKTLLRSWCASIGSTMSSNKFRF